MNYINVIVWILTVLLVVFIPFLFYKLGKRQKKGWFYFLLNLDLIPMTILLIVFSPIIILNAITFLSNLAFLVLVIYLISRFFRTKALYEASEDENLGWTYVIFYLPVLGWLIYYISKL